MSTHYGDETKLPANTFKKAGFIFVGWTTDSNTTETVYTNEDIVSVTEDVTLYAVWEKPVFSVSKKKTVVFSKGNLCYSSETGDYAFEENQYDCRTYSGGPACIGGVRFTTGTSNGDVGLFYWSKSAEIARAKLYNDSATSADDSFFADGLTVGGEKWSVLSIDEWIYLVNKGEDAEYKYGAATVSEMIGIVILPEGFSFISGTNDNYEANKYSVEEWKAMEEAGAVFLSASGDRYGTVGASDKFSQWGACWTTTTPSADKARQFHFQENGFSYNNAITRQEALSIRIVKEYD